MAPRPIRLLLADVDGTLVTPDKVLTDRTIAAVAKLKDAGVLFAVTSSGLSIAMGNADRDVQRAARHVTTTNEDDGFANAAERFILP